MAPTGIGADRVAAYVRWSTDDQANGTTLAVQRDACLHFIRSQGWVWREDLLFVDDGHSGGSLQRPAMARLRAAVAAGELDCVVVHKIDRLSRNIVDATQLVLREWRGRCHLKSVLEPIDTATDMGRMIFGLLAMFADFERAAIRERTQGGKIRRIRDGEQMHGRPAFGYAPHPSQKGRWVEEPARAALVRRMFTLVAGGMSAGRLTRLLNAEGALTAGGRPWSVSSLLHLLHNPTYSGVVEYGRTSLLPAGEGTAAGGGPHRVRVRHAAPRVRGATAAAPALVPPETFAAAQAVLAGHRARLAAAGARAQGSPHLLVGISECACGRGLVHKSPGSRRPGRTRYYLCPGRREGTCGASAPIPAVEAELLVQEAFLAVFAVEGLERQRLQRALAGAAAPPGDRAAPVAAARRQLRRLEAEEAHLLRAARAGTLPLDELRALRASLRRDRAEALGRLAMEEEQRGRAAATEGLLAGPLQPRALWEGLEAWRQREVLRGCLQGRIRLLRPAAGGEVRIEARWLVGG